MSFSHFEHSETGARVAGVLKDKEALGRMEAFSRAGRPALLAVAGEIEKVAPALTDTEKQHVGRWVHRLLGPRGWRPVDKKRMPKGGLFTTAAVYGRAGAEPGPEPVSARADAHADLTSGTREMEMSARERLRSAQAIVAALPVRPMSVDEFIAEKRREALRDE